MNRPPPAARRARLLAPALALLTLAGCKIPTTGVIDAGEPASGVSARPVVYLVRDGRLQAVARDDPEASTVWTVTLAMLAKGPTPQERTQGLTTEFPLLSRLPRVRGEDGRLVISLPAATPGLTDLGVSQLACTVVSARALAGVGDRPHTAVVVGPDGDTRHPDLRDCRRAEARAFRSVPPTDAPSDAPEPPPDQPPGAPQSPSASNSAASEWHSA